jgi:hypothetical protein
MLSSVCPVSLLRLPPTKNQTPPPRDYGEPQGWPVVRSSLAL